MPFLVSVGELPRVSYSSGSTVIARLLNSTLVDVSFEKAPNQELINLTKNNETVQIIGDAAMLHPSGLSWLDGLGAWKQPVILMVQGFPSGEISGMASAYTSLCREFSVPLVGLVQLGGEWNSYLRRIDTLPWCGYIPDECLNKDFMWKNISLESSILVERLGTVIWKRINFIRQ